MDMCWGHGEHRGTFSGREDRRRGNDGEESDLSEHKEEAKKWTGRLETNTRGRFRTEGEDSRNGGKNLSWGALSLIEDGDQLKSGFWWFDQNCRREGVQDKKKSA